MPTDNCMTTLFLSERNHHPDVIISVSQRLEGHVFLGGVREQHLLGYDVTIDNFVVDKRGPLILQI